MNVIFKETEHFKVGDYVEAHRWADLNKPGAYYGKIEMIDKSSFLPVTARVISPINGTFVLRGFHAHLIRVITEAEFIQHMLER